MTRLLQTTYRKYYNNDFNEYYSMEKEKQKKINKLESDRKIKRTLKMKELSNKKGKSTRKIKVLKKGAIRKKLF